MEEDLDNCTSLFSSALTITNDDPTHKELTELVQKHHEDVNAFLVSIQNLLLKSNIGEHGSISTGTKGLNFNKIRDSINNLKKRAILKWPHLERLIGYVLKPLNDLKEYRTYKVNDF